MGICSEKDNMRDELKKRTETEKLHMATMRKVSLFLYCPFPLFTVHMALTVGAQTRVMCSVSSVSLGLTQAYSEIMGHVCPACLSKLFLIIFGTQWKHMFFINKEALL